MMKFPVICCCLFLFPYAAFGQQSLFNALSGDRTNTGKHFFQMQTNAVKRNQVITNNTYDYGLSDNVEIGVNWFDIPLIIPDNTINDQEIMANAQYFYQENDWLQFSAGLQSGFVKDMHGTLSYGQVLFINSKWLITSKKIKFVFGLLKGNNHYLSSTLPIVQTGVEWPIINEKIHFIADYISGSTENSVGVIGAAFFVTQEFIISFGYQYPSYHSNNPTAFVIEITWVEANKAT
ncbi:MAG: hypothetical protein H6623_07370 [Bdellovibrionaceae bacterium]|nr:hypothetical protein [Pseudobdellovibrionaceae bacterium]